MKKIIGFLFLILVIAKSGFSQEKKHILNARFYEGQVLLRWAPLNYDSWKQGIDSGYTIQRIELEDLTNESNNWTILTDSALKPLSLESMKLKFGEKNNNAALAAQMLYGKTTVKNDVESLQNIISNSKAEQDNKFGFILLASSKDFEVATAVALGFKDGKIDQNKKYVYRLMSADTVYCILDLNNPKNVSYELPEVEMESKEKSAFLKWQTEDFPFWGYYLETKQKGQKDWKRTSSSPLININTRRDTLNTLPLIIETINFENNYEPIECRIVGIDDYGIENTGISFYAQGSDKTPPSIAEDVKAEGMDEKSIKLTWTWENKTNQNDFIGFRIDRAASNDFYFLPITDVLPSQTRNYMDKKPNRFGNNYYRIASIDTAGNESYSVFSYGMVYDSVAPSSPQNIEFTIDSLGIVKIKWDKPKEEDVMGYRIYFSNYHNHEYTTLTGNPIDTNYFEDTINLNTLTKKAYYKIVALDYHFNHSDYSMPIEIKRPDKIKPQAPFFTSYFTDGTFVKLNWTKSYSDDADTIVLKKRIYGQNDWVEIFFGKNNIDTLFEDKNVSRNEVYEYDILVIDESGLRSISENTLKIKTLPLQILEDIKDLKVEFNEEKKHALLTWNYAIKEQIYFIVYRSEDGINFDEMDYVENDFQFIDRNVKKGKLYYYCVKPVSRNGASGKQSEKISLTIK